MPKFLNKIFTKLQKRAAQPREGYFVLFFAVVLTMLMLPVLSGVLTTTVETRSEIADYYQAETARNEGESILFNKLESLSREHGLGYFENKTIETEDGRTVEYTFSAASVVTTPSTYTYGDLNLATPRTPTACSTWVDEDDEGRLSFRGCGEYPELATAVEDPNFYYTVPALGTGDVGGADCQPGKLPPELEGVEDPLDHPCSWNKLSLGQNVAIPLYINTSESDTTYEVYKPDSLTLRLRFKCEEFEKTYCPDEERLYITHRDLNDDLITRPSPTADTTPRVLDWAVEGKELVLPDNRGYFDAESGRSETSREITIQRFFQNTGNSNFEMFKAFVRESLLTVNFINPELNALLISDAFDSDAGHSDFLEFYNADGLLSLETGAPEDADIFTVTEDAPVLNLGFLNDYFEGCNSDRSVCRQITEIEYQIISNVPMGNHKFVATGTSENTDSTYALMKAEKSGPEVPTLPGTVFGS